MIVSTIVSSCMAIILSLIFPDKKLAGLWLRHLWSRPLVYLLFSKVKIHGKEHLDSEKSAVYIANHQSMQDIFLLYGWLETDFRWMMKKELMALPILGHACRTVGHISVDRGNSRKSMESIQAAKKILVMGTSLAVFPEGTRSKVGHMQKFKSGAFRLAKELELPIAPISLKGLYKVVENQKWYLRLGQTIEITFHPVIDSQKVQHSALKELMQESHAIIEQGV